MFSLKSKKQMPQCYPESPTLLEALLLQISVNRSFYRTDTSLGT